MALCDSKLFRFSYMYSAAVTEVIDIHEAAICEKVHLGINCPWKMADVAKERELARLSALWHS